MITRMYLLIIMPFTILAMDKQIETEKKVTKCGYHNHYSFGHLTLVEYVRPVLHPDGTSERGKIQWMVPTSNNRLILAQCAVAAKQMIKGKDNAFWEREMFAAHAAGSVSFSIQVSR